MIENKATPALSLALLIQKVFAMPVSSVGDNRKTDRNLVEYDDKQRSLDLSTMNLIPPAVGIFDEPTRCYKLNHEWSKIIIGMVSWLAATPVWKDAENEGYSAIEEILKFMTQTEVCMNCDGVEDCLEASDIITLIETTLVTNITNITINETAIIDNTTEITEIVNNPPDGSTYPPEPDRATEPDPACGAAYYCVQELRAWIEDVEGLPVTYPTILDAMEALLAGELSLSFAIVIALLQNVYTVPPPASILADFDAQVDDMREWLYCEGFDKPAFDAYVRATLTNGEAIADYIAGVAFVTWEQWYTIGSTDLTQDCSSFLCGVWVNTFDFTIEAYEWVATDGGGYPDDAGHYVAGVGWESDVRNKGAGNNSVLSIALTMPFGVDVTRVLVEFTATGGGAREQHKVRLIDTGSSVWTGTLPNTVGSHSTDFTDLTEDSIDIVKIDLHDTDETRTFLITKVIIEGTGTDPELGA